MDAWFDKFNNIPQTKPFTWEEKLYLDACISYVETSAMSIAYLKSSFINKEEIMDGKEDKEKKEPVKNDKPAVNSNYTISEYDKNRRDWERNIDESDYDYDERR